MHALTGRLQALGGHFQRLAERRTALLERTHQAGFYQNEILRDQTFGEIHRLEQFLAWRERWELALENTAHRVTHMRGRSADDRELREKLDHLDHEFDQIDSVARTIDTLDLSDALICLSLVDRTGDAQDGVVRLSRMYCALAARRRMSAEVLAEFFHEKEDRAIVHVTALGAHALFKHEAGLHQLDHRLRTNAHRTGREKEREDREIVRVDVLPFQDTPNRDFLARVTGAAKPLRPARTRLLTKADTVVSLFHEPSLRSLDLWAGGPKDKALATVQRILGSMVGDSGKNSGQPPADDIIRRYPFGVGPLVKDPRTGRSTNRVEQVFAGEIDFLHLETTETPK